MRSRANSSASSAPRSQAFCAEAISSGAIFSPALSGSRRSYFRVSSARAASPRAITSAIMPRAACSTSADASRFVARKASKLSAKSVAVLSRRIGMACEWRADAPASTEYILFVRFLALRASLSPRRRERRNGQARSPVFFAKAPGAPFLSFLTARVRGWRAGRRNLCPCLRSLSGIAAPSGAPSRRSQSGAGPRFPSGSLARTVSQLLAGGRSASGRSPGAARERTCEARARAPHPDPHETEQPVRIPLAGSGRRRR